MKPSPQGPWVKGINAAASPLAQPKGSFPRASNLVYTQRGSLTQCDGTSIINWYSGAIQNNRGEMEAIALFQPTNVARYFMVLEKALDQPLSPITSITATDGGSGGSTLAAGTYFYLVTALDGAGGETSTAVGNQATVTIASGHKINVSWPAVPNAIAYNIYRSTVSGAEQLLTGGGLPVTTNSYTDTGAATFALGSATITSLVAFGSPSTPATNIQVNLASSLNVRDGSIVTITGASPTTFNQTVTVFTTTSSTSFVTTNTNPALLAGVIGTGGTASFTTTFPTINTTQQVALYKMPNVGNQPLTYTDSSIVALFPADARPSVPGGPAGGNSGGGSGGGGSLPGGAPPTGSGGVPGNTSPLPQMVQFQDKLVLALGNGYAPQVFTDPSTVAAITSTFTPAYPSWSATTQYSPGSIVQPATPNGFYYIAIQTQTAQSGATSPTFPVGVGQTTPDGGIIWQNKGTTASGAPPPPGAAHAIVYAGSLWLANTSPTNTSTGIDGPSALRMSDVNDVNSWNPINTAFLDKDDGTQIQGMAAFTITAQGIPPSGSLVVFKDFSTFQVQGVFGASDFAIQRTKSDLGCIAPRSIQFVPGFGIVRLTHLGIAVFDGVEDRIISEEIRPYLFFTNDADYADIAPMDSNYSYSSFGFQTADPPMYNLLIPVGNAGTSGGQLTRILSYDLVLRAWSVIDLPFALSTATQVRAAGATPTTIFGGFNDGTVQRWQAGDEQWYSGGPSPSQVQWSFRTPEVFLPSADQRLYCRNFVLRGVSTDTAANITVTPAYNGLPQSPITRPLPATGDFDIFVPIGATALRFNATVAGTTHCEILACNWHVNERPLRVPLTVA